ncbi:MAG: phosphoenolpyruvate carboxylase [Planctomycetes bacterium]|nr:phosphoenolpyruvate carboxylase [Planctomycetota bacterium]
MGKRASGLSPRLRTLVGEVETLLGEAIVAAEGQALYDAVEAVRLDMVRARDGSPRVAQGALRRARTRMAALEPRERAALARSYTLYLELVNVCENAYRSARLRQRSREEEQPSCGARVVYVLTAHPTESRSPKNIELLRRIQGLLIEALDAGRPVPREPLAHLLQLAWRIGTHPPHKPTVEDEARHLFSLVSDEILTELLRLEREGDRVLIRTWVGGDKDGHPGVGPEQTDASLNLSRERLLGFVETRLWPRITRDLALIGEDRLSAALVELERCLADLKRVTLADGRRLTCFRAALVELSQRYEAICNVPHPALAQLDLLLFLFPGLVIPLELREERGLFERSAPIGRMLEYLGHLARGGRIEWYVRGLVVSMTDSAQDLLEAQALVIEIFGEVSIPIVPLFELPSVLPRAPEILENALSAGLRGSLPGYEWDLEVMLGYSDTSKRMGVLPSRLAIHDAMRAIGEWAKKRKQRILFFHGSGGSVGRGGGRTEERFATWPQGACATVKETLQGEMVERTLASREILRSQVHQIGRHQTAPPKPSRVSALTRELASVAESTYVEVVDERAFQRLLASATPYTRLGTLTIGSRPSKRAKTGGLDSLRAIPWVLCWTQTRYLLHAWLGTGAAWLALEGRLGKAEARVALDRAIRTDALLRAYLRVLGFTLAKTAPAIWEAYVRELAPDTAPGLVRRLKREYDAALDLARAASQDGKLLSYRPWLSESIHLRAPMIHPLNLLQLDVLALKRLNQGHESLFRETITGIAAGMLTTG